MVVPPKKFVFLDYSKTAGETESAITPSDIIKQKRGRGNVKAILAITEDRQRNAATYLACNCLAYAISSHLLVVESLVLAILLFALPFLLIAAGSLKLVLKLLVSAIKEIFK
ncbi:hypothetical protein [Limosilactobacillus ingluviei]|uniref:hypothetical protein n=1 Tax=Limosilactobacillus ingluviei TaxID=148604 RepID=UPI000593C26A|nr:hypothetical protein [Limosilactobacillus ingluviei]